MTVEIEVLNDSILGKTVQITGSHIEQAEKELEELKPKLSKEQYLTESKIINDLKSRIRRSGVGFIQVILNEN